VIPSRSVRGFQTNSREVEAGGTGTGWRSVGMVSDELS